MPRYTPLPYVAERRPRNLRLADLYLRSGEQIADSERRAGEIQAQLWGNIGNAVGQAASSAIMAPTVQREQQAKLAREAQQTELGALQLGEAKREVNERENYNVAMGSGLPEDDILKSLEGHPELYDKAKARFKTINDSTNKLFGDVAEGVMEFDYSPDAAMKALDVLISKGFDERRFEQHRAAIQKDPSAVKKMVDALLAQSPDPRHQQLVKPDLTEVSPGATVVDKKTGKPVYVAPNPAAEAAARNMQVDNERAERMETRAGAAQQATQRHQEAMERIALQKANAALGAGELTNKQMSQAIQLTNSLKGHPAYTDMNDIANGWKGVQTGLSQKNGFGDITAINAFQRMVDPGATVREGDVVLLQSASSWMDKVLSEYPLARLQKGDKLPDAVRARMEKTAKDLYALRSKNYNDTIGSQYRKLAQSAAIPFELVGQEFATEPDDTGKTAPKPAGAVAAAKPKVNPFRK